MKRHASPGWGWNGLWDGVTDSRHSLSEVEHFGQLVNFGLGIYNWASDSASHWFVQLLIQVPVLFAFAIKYVILFPLYELAKAIVGDKIVGVVKQNVNYYAEAAEWYIDELINMDPQTMSSDELFHLSYINTELSDIKSKI